MTPQLPLTNPYKPKLLWISIQTLGIVMLRGMQGLQAIGYIAFMQLNEV